MNWYVWRQLIEQRSLPMEPGQPERVDYAYRRHGVVDLSAVFAPLACKRVVKVTESRTVPDFAHFEKFYDGLFILSAFQTQE